ncbi:MAG: hypothetical protein WAN87_05815 [Thermoplasmata archaeon]
MVFIFDDSGVFEAPIGTVWTYFNSGLAHRSAHHHRKSKLEELSEASFVACWEQDYEGGPVVFRVHGTEYPPLGLAYEILEGPFVGSKFFIYYTPLGDRTRVSLVGEFASDSIPTAELESKVTDFFATEFEQDRMGLHRFQTKD